MAKGRSLLLIVWVLLVGWAALGGPSGAWAAQPTKATCPKAALLTDHAAQTPGTVGIIIGENNVAVGFQYRETGGTSTVEIQYCCWNIPAECDLTTGKWAQVAGSSKSLDSVATPSEGASIDNPFPNCWYRAAVTACAGCTTDAIGVCVPK